MQTLAQSNLNFSLRNTALIQQFTSTGGDAPVVPGPMGLRNSEAYNVSVCKALLKACIVGNYSWYETLIVFLDFYVMNLNFKVLTLFEMRQANRYNNLVADLYAKPYCTWSIFH